MGNAVRRFMCVLGLVLGASGCGPSDSGNHPGTGECGDGVVQREETCDDGQHVAGDGCSEACQVETGWECKGEPSSCTRQTAGCANGSAHCDANALCTETPGSFVCTCKPGYSGDGVTCADIDECTRGAAPCGANAACTNTAGSFTCACNAGYSGDGITCTDIDECTRGTAECSASATCTNKTGGYTCACKAGYTGDGVTCTDINECTSGEAHCSTNAACTNTGGAYTCACKAGYTGDGVTCTDIDECANPAICPSGETCSNTPGGYTCAPASCAPPRTTCGDLCVDTTSDSAHCGSCTTVCGNTQSCVGSTCVGSGKLQFSATWSRPGDGDLLVTTPTGKLVYWGNLGPDAGSDSGHMDRDDVSGQGPENIYWGVNTTPPSGTYHICFETPDFRPNPSTSDPVSYSIKVQRPGQASQTFTGRHTGVVSQGACDKTQPGYVTSITYP
jgi:cysteine-rich repeat protein